MHRLLKALAPNQKTAPYWFIAPLALIFLAFVVYPVGDSLVLSFQKFAGGKYAFVGLDNYLTLVNDPVFLITLRNTAIYFVLQVPLMVVLALVLAVLVEVKGLRGRAFFRMSLYLPAVTALVAYSLVFKLLLNKDYGVFNYLLSLAGVPAVDWLNSPNGARASIVLSTTWRWTGYNMIIMIAGLTAIPEELYESASIDGANALKKFLRITMPMMKNIILFVTITSTIGTFQLFDESYVLTGGGPNNATITMAHYLYNTGFRYFKFGYAAAISYAMVVIIMLLSAVQFRLGGERDAR